MTTTADLLVTNGTLWNGSGIAGADSVAVRGGEVIAVGRSAELAGLRGPATRVLDAAGGTVTPGLVDAHLHLLAWARSLDEVDLSGAATRAEALARVARRAAERPGSEPIVGRGWNASGWREAPHRDALDAIALQRPVLLHSHDEHNLWINSAALRAAGIDRRSPDPAGGWIEHDAAGEPTGLLREHAMRLATGLEPVDREADAARVERACRRLLRAGITAVHDFEGADATRALRAVLRGPGARVRVLAHLPHSGLEHVLALGLESGLGDSWFRLGGVKLFADGTLGSRTAALLEPYEGTADLGRELMPADELRETVRRALQGGLSVAIHAIGDRAVRAALDAFEACRPWLARAALPSRVEHLQLVDDLDLPRFARLGVAASMQPAHCTSDAPLAERFWGARIRRSYPWRRAVESGALLAFGSDAPVEPPWPALGLYAAVTRLRPDRSQPFVPEQRLDLDRSLAAYVSAPARLSGLWPRWGTLAPGSAADLVVWNADLHRLPAVKLAEARPAATVLDGELAYRAEEREDAAREARSLPAAGSSR